jgi:hypothetical protein
MVEATLPSRKQAVILRRRKLGREQLDRFLAKQGKVVLQHLSILSQQHIWIFATKRGGFGLFGA